jgi:hypothetical protein
MCQRFYQPTMPAPVERRGGKDFSGLPPAEDATWLEIEWKARGSSGEPSSALSASAARVGAFFRFGFQTAVVGSDNPPSALERLGPHHRGVPRNRRGVSPTGGEIAESTGITGDHGSGLRRTESVFTPPVK